VEWVESFKFLDVHINKELSWSKHTKTVVKRAQQNLFLLKTLKIFGMGPQTLYTCTVENNCTVGCIITRYGNCLASDHKALQRVVRMGQYITGAKLPAIQELYNRRCQRKAHKIVRDSSHPSYRQFALVPHGKWYQRAKLGPKSSSTASTPKP
jgi:hypothetical protein